MMSPTRIFKKTVFPAPLRPMMRLVLPGKNSMLMPFSTSLSSKDLNMFSALINVSSISEG
jgi:hypothetical protein